ncbi:MAG: hypothetical protein JWR22_1232 [Herminiimonas sp.]|nr:hypothetical protein [Herminiimonas sp.]
MKLSHSASSPRLGLLLFALVCVATAALYGQFLWNPVVFDDHNFFGGPVHPDNLTLGYLFGIRGLAYGSFEWTRHLVGLQLIWYRAGNLLIHIATCLVLFQFLHRLFEVVLEGEQNGAVAVRVPQGGALSPLWLAFFGSLLFALHPVSVYATAYLIQRTSLLAGLFTLCMLLLFLEGVVRQRRELLVISALAYVLAVYSKEHAIMAPALAGILLILLRRRWWESWREWSVPFVLYALIALRVVLQLKSNGIMGAAYEPRGGDMLAELARQYPGFDPHMAYPLSIMTQGFLFFKYLLLWIVPNPDWMAVDMFERFAVRFMSWPETAGFVAFILYAGVALRLLYKRGRAGLLGFAMLCPWLMFATELSTVRIQETFVLYRSYLWMPCLFAALPYLFRRVKAVHAAALLGIVGLVFASLAWNRLVTFSSALKLWDDAAKLTVGKDKRPGVERVYHNRGLAYTRDGQLDRALTDLNKSLTIKPGQVYVLNDRGVTLSLMKRYPEALRDFNEGLAIGPGFVMSRFGRAETLNAMGDNAAAHAEYLDLCMHGVPEGCRGLPREEFDALLQEERDRLNRKK